MIRSLAFVPLIIAVVFGGFLLWGLNPDRDPNSIPSELISQPAPDFDLPAVEGLDTPSFSSADFKDLTKPVIVNVFASWCVPCRAEHAVLTRLVEKDGAQLFGINYKDEPEDAVNWLGKLGNPYARIGSDLNGRAGIEWGISGVPETFIVGTDGTVLYRYVGPVVGDTPEKKFRRALVETGAIESES